MKKLILAVAVLAVGAAALTMASPVLAAGSRQGGPGNGFAGSGWQGGDGLGTALNQGFAGDGVLEELMHQSLAEALGISVPQLEAELNSGTTLIEIALSLGFSPEAAADLLASARADALRGAVADGLISQEQADWLSSRAFGARGQSGAGICLRD